jgi:hypothetical protein
MSMDSKDLSIIAQNAGNTAAVVMAPLVAQSGEFDAALFNDIRRAVFDGTFELYAIGLAETGINQSAPSRPASNGSSYASNGGGSRTDDHGAGVEIKFGKHKGQTIGDLYASGEDGQSYIEWLADKSNNDFLRTKAQEFLASV